MEDDLKKNEMEDELKKNKMEDDLKKEKKKDLIFFVKNNNYDLKKR
jgi:hypothetical protein